MSTVLKAWIAFVAISIVSVFVWLAFSPDLLFARNISNYKDLITNSAPDSASNHTLSFILQTNINPSSYIEVIPPVGFEVLATSTFVGERNVELYVNGTLRDVATTLGPNDDMAEIFTGSPGMIRYTLNSTEGISAGSQLELKIGNHTSRANSFSETFGTTTGTSTGTTTIEADVKPIINSDTAGSKMLDVKIYDGVQVAEANFWIAVVEQVGVGPVDTTEEIPPYIFNGSPTTTITGVTLNVEIFVETDELAICKYDLASGTAYSAMPYTFTNTGTIYHTKIVSVIPNSTQQFFIRCLDDEGNFNTEDYLLEFAVSEIPTGTSNTEGDLEGNGTGSGNSGTGSGSGGGGASGSSDGGASEAGNTNGPGGGGSTGGGGGGGSGEDSGSTAGGGFESTDAPYRSGDGRVDITGHAFPNSEVTALVDGKVTITKRADNQGLYSITIDQIARGAYTFGVYAVDAKKVKSSTFSTSFTVTGARTSTLSNINIAPSVIVSPDPVDPGKTLTASGYAIPNAKVTIENMKDGSTASLKTLTATSDGNGFWSITIDTNGFTSGTYKIRVKSALEDGSVVSSFSNYLLYGVGQAAVKPRNADLNRDGKVNLVDFSILLFWWNTDGGTSNPSADINADGKVSLTDFSILLFNWTG